MEFNAIKLKYIAENKEIIEYNKTCEEIKKELTEILFKLKKLENTKINEKDEYNLAIKPENVEVIKKQINSFLFNRVAFGLNYVVSECPECGKVKKLYNDEGKAKCLTCLRKLREEKIYEEFEIPEEI